MTVLCFERIVPDLENTLRIGAKELAAVTTAKTAFLGGVCADALHDTVAGVLMFVRAMFDHAINNDLPAKNSGRKLLLPVTR